MAASIAAVSAHAQSTWDNTGTGVWNTPGNWSTDSVPTTTAIFGTSSQNPVTFSASASIQTLQINTGSSSYTFDLGRKTLIVNSGIIDSSANVIEFQNGTITGSGGITLNAGAGELVLGNTATYTGATTINGGTLSAGLAGALSPNSAVTDNGQLDLGLANQTIKSLAGSGIVTNSGTSGTQTLKITGNATSTFSGVIQDGTSGAQTALALSGKNTTLILTGSNTLFWRHHDQRRNDVAARQWRHRRLA